MSGVTTEAKVGVFVLIAILLLAYMSVRIGGIQLGKGGGYSVYAVFDNASGLKKDTGVEIAGITVGKVADITLEDARAKITLLINSEVSLPIDSKAMIRTRGVLGDKFVELTPGSPDLEKLKDGDRIVNAMTPTDIDQIITQVGHISEDIKRVTNTLSGVLGTEQGEAELRAILGNFSEMSANLAKLTRDNNEALQKMIQNLTVFSEDLRTMSTANKDNINLILASFAETSKRMSRTIATLQEVSDKINRGEGTFGQLVNDDTTVRELNKTLASLRDISQKISEGRGTLGKLVNDPSTGEKLDDALDGVNTYLSKQEQFKVYVDYHAEYMLDRDKSNTGLRSVVNIRIQPRADQYYILGVVYDPYGSFSKKERTYTTGGASYTTIEETRDRDALLFNAQIAKRFYDLVIRGGIIESGGGVGLDYYMLDDQIKFTFEGFSGDIDHNAHLRLAMTYTFWKNFYVMAGYDDFISDQGRESPFVGIGLQFNDDDLKYLFSSAPIPSN